MTVLRLSFYLLSLDILFDDEDALIYEAETDGNIDYFVSMDNNKNLVKDNGMYQN